LAEIVQRCAKAISLGLGWLVGRVSEKGELEGSENVLFGYYKSLLIFTVAGRYLEAERVAHKIKRDFYKDGLFGGEQYPAAAGSFARSRAPFWPTDRDRPSILA
jgi:hypothetical protein